MYRIVVLDDISKVLWKGPMDRKYIVPLLYTGNHFEGLKNIAAYFKHKKFCIGLRYSGQSYILSLECDKFYSSDLYHRFNCKGKPKF